MYRDVGKGDGDVNSNFFNIHTLSQCEYSSTFKDMYRDVESGNVSSRYGSINSHDGLQQNGLKSLMN